MKFWYIYYRTCRAIWQQHAIRVELEDVLNEMLSWARASFQTGYRPTTLELHDFMSHVAKNPIVFTQRELNHLMNIEGWSGE